MIRILAKAIILIFYEQADKGRLFTHGGAIRNNLVFAPLVDIFEFKLQLLLLDILATLIRRDSVVSFAIIPLRFSSMKS